MVQFGWHKVLSISASDWAKGSGKNLEDYIMVGVHGGVDFIRLIPPGTEVVVDFRTMMCPLLKELNLYKEPGTDMLHGFYKVEIVCHYYGTALIPKEKYEDRKS